MNFKIALKNYLNGYFIKIEKVFDFQLFHIINYPQKQPDLETVVWLFLKSIPSWLGIFLNIQKFFNIYYIMTDEAVLGFNNKNFEFRIFFYKIVELPGCIILCFAISYQNKRGYLQSLYFRLLFFPLLHLITRSMKQIIQ